MAHNVKPRSVEGERNAATKHKLLDLVHGHKPPTVEEFLEHFFNAAGGPKLVAKMLYTEFLSARPGSMLRTRVLEMIVRALKYNEGKDKTVEMGLLDDNDLESMIQTRMQSLNAKNEDAKQLGPGTAPAAAGVPGPAAPAEGIGSGEGI